MVSSMPLMDMQAISIEIDGGWPNQGSFPAINRVDAAYLKVMGIPIVRGRGIFDQDNRPGAKRIAIVNEAMARAYSTRGGIIGRCLFIGGRGQPCVEIVGVARDAWMFVGSPPQPAYIVPIEPFRDLSSNDRAVVLRTREPLKIIELVRKEASAINPDIPYVNVLALGDLFESMLRPWRLGSWMFAGLGILALTISAIGLAGTIAYSVQRRRRELGIRKALGAQNADLFATVLQRTAAVVILGLVVGLAGARALGASLNALLFGIDATDWRVYAVAATLMVIAATAAAWTPAKRAARIDPSELLRSE